MTESFVFIHVPKTGGSFVRRSLEGALAPRLPDVIFHRLGVGTRLRVLPWSIRARLPFYPYKFWEVGIRHAPYSVLPGRYRDRTLLGCSRSPFALYRSHFTFRWWTRRTRSMFIPGSPPAPASEDSWSIDAFARYWDEHGRWANHPLNNGKVGNLTAQFICFFTEEQDSARIFAAHPDIDRMVALMREAMPPVTFLRTENLNAELASFLAEQGFSRASCEAVRHRAPVNRSSHRSRVVLSDWLCQFIRDREAFLFEFFPEYKDG